MNAIPTGLKILLSDLPRLGELIFASLKEKDIEVIPAEESPEFTPWNSAGFEEQSGKKKAQWKSEMNGRRFK